ncbi:MAG: hypothetical protein QOE90_893 [Thermoplasmata archaeon]|jgi:FtsP/CotA-like multicopper oxidase with cupredoxin domain|nr:hypothetical protein [Thermoplasmata archaeon]
MRSRAALVALGLLLLAGLGSGWSPPPAPGPQQRDVTWEVVALPCPAGTGPADGICLAYNGTIPGPTLDINLLDSVSLTLVNHVGQTVWSLPGPQDVKARLANASVSFHVHGMSLEASEDGMSHAMAPGFLDSFAPPGGSFTYHFRAPYNGTWHYHDHVLGPDGNEGLARGLEGALAVRAGGDLRPDAILDVHTTDRGAPFVSPTTTVPRGGTLEIVLAGLGDGTWTLRVTNLDGYDQTLQTAPGLSEHLLAPNAQGVYRWRLENDITGSEYEGTVSAP